MQHINLEASAMESMTVECVELTFGTEHELPAVVWVAPSKLERATEWLCTSGVALAAVGVFVAALATMGAR